MLARLLCCVFCSNLYAQTNCSNPKKVNICPSVLLMGQTNAGMLDDAPAGCNLPGEDVVYEIFAPNGIDKFYYAIVNASSPLTISIETSCGSGTCQSTAIGAGNTNGSFTVTSSSYYYVWIDAPGTVTYDISFGADTGSVNINIPNTQGNLQFDGTPCDTPVFLPAKPFFQVSYNGIDQTDPMTLAPLGVPGNLCIKTFFRNTTGIEGVKKFTFNFNPLGFPSFAASPATIPGHYNTGNWVSSVAGDSITFTFVDALGIGKGDFLIPGTCLEYEFCFTVVPISNNPQLTNVKVNVLSDGFGMGYTGPVHTGCCPIPYVNCIGGGGGSVGSGAHAFGFAFDDPGTLPVELISFNADAQKKDVLLTWATASEINNDYFSIERSADSKNWEKISSIDGAGNSNVNIRYEFTDTKPLDGISFYRLKQTDFNGAYTYSATEKVLRGETNNAVVFPNPSHSFVKIFGSAIAHAIIFNSIGRQLPINLEDKGDYKQINTLNMASGIYFLLIEHDNGTTQRERLIVNHN